MMDLRRLRYFVAVAETGNISKAAQKIFLTQPALSRQIKALEDEIGLLLMERQAHSVRLTPAGEALLPEARDLLRHAREALERVRSCGQGARLRIGYAPSLASGLLSDAVERFTRKQAGVRVELLDLSSRELLAGLEEGALDIALTVAPERATRGLRWVPLGPVAWRLALHHRHPLAALPVVDQARLAREPLLVFSQRDYPEYWQYITAWLRGEGLHPAIAGEYDGINSLLAAVESRLGVALVTGGCAAILPRKIRLRPLSGTPENVMIAAGYRAGRESEAPFAILLDELRRSLPQPGAKP